MITSATFLGGRRCTLLALTILIAGCGGSLPADGVGTDAVDPRFDIEAEARRIPVRQGSFTSMHPQPFIGSSATVYLLVPTGSAAGLGLDMLISHDGGDSFGPAIPVASPQEGVVSHGENSPRLAVTPTEVHALWEQPGPGGISRLVHARSVDFGHSFEAAKPVTSKGDPSFNGFATMAASPAGDVYAAWLDGRDMSRNMETFDLFVSVSRDRGAVFGEDVRVGQSGCPCCRPSIAFGDETAHIAWRYVFEGNVRDIVVSTSRDGGATFADPVRVAADNWVLAGCPHSGPSIVGNAERLWVAWFTAGGDSPAGVRVSWSDDGGRTFAASLPASGSVFDANHPQLTISEDGRVLLVFQGREGDETGSWGPLRPWVIEVTDPTSLSTPTTVPVDSASATYPAIAAGPSGQALVAWTETINGFPVAITARMRDR